MTYADELDDQIKKAPFVFMGTVRTVGKSNVAAIKSNEKTIVVVIDKVLQAPKQFERLAGKEVTIQLSDIPQAKEGQKGAFLATPLVYGESLGVKGTAKFESDMLAEFESKVAVSKARTQDAKEREQVTAAESIVTGRVLQSRIVEPKRLRAARAAFLGQGPEVDLTKLPVSEHEPIWHEVVIEVDQVLKGNDVKQATIVYPVSNDVMWRDFAGTAAKLEAMTKEKSRSKQIFFLHKNQIESKGLNSALLSRPDVEKVEPAFTSRNEADVVPASPENIERIRKVLGKEGK